MLLQKNQVKVAPDIGQGYVSLFAQTFFVSCQICAGSCFTWCIVCVGQKLGLLSLFCLSGSDVRERECFLPRSDRNICVFTFVLSLRICGKDISYQGALYVFGES